MSAYIRSSTRSITMAGSAFTPSPLNTLSVAHVVGMEAEQRAAEFNAAQRKTVKQPELRTPSLLGCYVNGKLRFQSRDHEAIYGYALDKMSDFRNDVWVTPVGSFVTEENKQKRSSKKTKKIAAA